MTDVTYTWEIGQVETRPSLDGLSNVVTKAMWTLRGERDDLTGYYMGAQPMGDPDGETFIAFENLTKEIIEGWIVQEMGLERLRALKATILSQIEAKVPEMVTVLADLPGN